MAQKLQYKTQPKSQRRNKRLIASCAAGLILLAGTGIFANLYWSDNSNPIASNPPSHTVSKGEVFIPKIQLPKQTNEAANMIGLIVYQGKVYTQTDTHITPESAKPLLGDKIGRTKGNIDEWSSYERVVNSIVKKD